MALGEQRPWTSWDGQWCCIYATPDKGWYNANSHAGVFNSCTKQLGRFIQLGYIFDLEINSTWLCWVWALRCTNQEVASCTWVPLRFLHRTLDQGAPEGPSFKGGAGDVAKPKSRGPSWFYSRWPGVHWGSHMFWLPQERRILSMFGDILGQGSQWNPGIMIHWGSEQPDTRLLSAVCVRGEQW